jgi:hypothetical protein
VNGSKDSTFSTETGGAAAWIAPLAAGCPNLASDLGGHRAGGLGSTAAASPPGWWWILNR